MKRYYFQLLNESYGDLDALIPDGSSKQTAVNRAKRWMDENGCAIFTDEHPQQQWIFARSSSFKRAVNKAVAIAKARKYPKPIEVW